MAFFQTVSPFVAFSPKTLLRFFLSVALALIVGWAVSPPASHAQDQNEIPDFCTILEQSPLTEGARSVLNEEWDANAATWTSVNRIIQTFNGGTLTQLTFQEPSSSGDWEDTDRATPEYDDSDRLTLCTVETKQDGSFVNSSRIDVQYDENGRTATRLFQAWNTDTEEWVDVLRSTFEYDDSGNNTKQVLEAWNSETQTWFNTQRIQKEYDSDNRVTKTLRETWDLASQSWVNDTRIQFTYSSDTQEEVEETWEDGTWVKDQRRTTSLNSDGFPTSTLTEDWNGSEWVNSSQSENTYMTYDGAQKLERVVREKWDANAGEWMNASRDRFSYDDIIPVELARFDAQRDGENTVRLAWKTASETNNSGFALQRQVAGTNASWTTVHFAEGAGTTSEPQSYQFTDKGLPYEAETVRYRLKQVDFDGTTHFSNEVEVQLGTPNRLALQAPFPNPVRNQATVRYELPEATEVHIALYDVLGRRVATPVDGRKDAGRAQVRLRTQHLPSGTYVLRLQASEQTRTQQLTVVK